ncbi:ATP-binding protein [Alkalihalobacterium alkalinitrilicum]|uniref:ATP-binding protein n=1 Tax=Alkalihalobacterium alkalinitrilicum TaxID=427920 RepID=UPI0013038C2A|nr:ATP-binding protein [Alkalihalobacterium alkalinitrilicum]
MITLIPAIIISHALALHKIEDYENKYLNLAQNYAHLHASHIERFIRETVSRLDMLATLIDVNSGDLSTVEEILTRTHEKDVRFSGFYWSNPQGDLLIGTNELTQPINILDREYFQNAINTGQYTISPAHIGRVTNRFIITIATPVISGSEVNGVLLGSLRIDKIEESLLGQLNNEKVFVTDDIGQAVIHSSTPYDEPISFEIQMESVPWTVQAQVEPVEKISYVQILLQYFGLLLIFTHILFLLVQYFLLKKQVKLEKKQNEMQKLELVENLAASTAHEIRNPLTGIKGLIQLLSEKYKDEKDQLYFTIIQSEVNRINSIVSELLLLGKPTAQTLNTYYVNDIIKEIEPIISSEANYKSVHLSIIYSNEPLPISCVKDHVKQVILNLVKNALEAIGDGRGKVIISLEKHQNQSIIKVIDNGSGMPEEVLNQVFNPFFTMKDDGSGLGLVVCKRIIETYGGQINIRSTMDKGTVVELRIPLTSEDND